MKIAWSFFCPALAAMVFSVVSGCATSSPYDHAENWIVKEDAARAFAIPSDVIYVQGEFYTDVQDLPSMEQYVRYAVGGQRFAGLARVFSPLITYPEDIKTAVGWYLDNLHEAGRPFVFIGEGRCGAALKMYEESHRGELESKGLVASFYTDEENKGFVTGEMVRKIRNAVFRARYRAQWGRDMPEGMLSE